MWKFNCVQNGCPFRSNSSISLRNHSRCCHYISTSIIEEENIPGHENNIEHTNTPVTNIRSNTIIGANIGFTNEEEPISERDTNTLNSSSIYGTESEHNTCITEERNGKITNNIETDINNVQDEDILPQISP